MARGGQKYQPTQWELVPYQLTGGIDTKFHGLTLPPPKLQNCQNAYVDQTGSLQRRFGRTALGTTDANGNTISSAFVAAGQHQGRLLGYTATNLYDYSEASARWNDRGRCTSWKMRSEPVASEDTVTAGFGSAMDMAVSGSYRCYVFDYYTGTTAITGTTTAFTIVDSHGTTIVSAQALSTVAAQAESHCKVVAIGARFYITYFDITTAATLRTKIIDTTSAATIATSVAAAAAATATDFDTTFDTCASGANGVFLAYNSTTATTLKFGFINTAGAFVNTSSAAVGAASVACTVIGTALHGIAYATALTPNDVFALLRSWNGAAWTSTATSAALDIALTAAVTQVACAFDSATVLRVWYAGDTNVTYPCVRQATFSTGGVITRRTTLSPRVHLASRPFQGADGATYWWAFTEPKDGVVQPTLLLYKQDGTLAAWANEGLAMMDGGGSRGVPHVAQDDATYSVFTQYFTQLSSGGFFTGSGAKLAMRQVSVDMASDDSHVGVEDGATSIMPSGILQQFDGRSVVELGFLSLVDASRVTCPSSNGAGSLTNAAGTLYSYMIVPEWSNAQGEREQGSNTGSVTTLPFVLNDDTVVLGIDTIPWTLKQAPRANLVFAIYRTLANPTSSSPFYRVGSRTNDPTADRVSFTDLMSDAVAATKEQFAFGDAGELDNIAPPPGDIVCAGNGRVFVGGLPDNPNQVWYSKLRGPGQALTFNDALTIQFPTSTGRITGLAVLNDSLIAFCERAIYRVNGNGVNNTGTAGGFTDPILVSTDISAIGPRGVVITPGGVMFDSTSRGIALVPPSMSGASYIGAPLEKLADPGLCTGACVVPALQQVRFSFAATTHVFDYYHQQWYVFTHASDGPTCVWNDAHVAIDAVVVHDDTTVYADAGDSYTMELKLGFVTGPSSRRSDLAVRSLGLVGTSLAAHALSVYVRYNQGATSETVIETSVLASGVLDPIWRVGQQFSSSIEVTIRDALLDVYGADIVAATAGMKLNELVFELGLRSQMLGRDV